MPVPIGAAAQPAPCPRRRPSACRSFAPSTVPAYGTSHGCSGPAANRRDIARPLWRPGSPNWGFDEVTFAASAESFDNPDFVEVTTQSYRLRYGNAPGDPAYDAWERLLAMQLAIAVPTVVLHGDCDGVGRRDQGGGRNGWERLGYRGKARTVNACAGRHQFSPEHTVNRDRRVPKTDFPVRRHARCPDTARGIPSRAPPRARPKASGAACGRR